MKLVFMGTPDFAVETLKALVERSGHEIVLVVTQPDKPKGRGHKMMPPPVKEYALAHEIPVYQPTSMKNEESAEKLAQVKADVFVVAAYGKLLPETVLNIPPHGCINVHASLLPKYRGAAPIQWSIVNGESVSGVTTMLMEKGLDTGDMLLKQEVPIVETETGSSLHDKLSVTGAALLLKTLDELEAGTDQPEKQDDCLSWYAPMLNKEVSKIDFTKTSREIYNLVRGMNSYPYAHTEYQGRRMKVIWAEQENSKTSGQNGEILEVTPKGILVKCADGAINITQIQFDGKKQMPVREYIKGNTIETGVILQ